MASKAAPMPFHDGYLAGSRSERCRESGLPMVCACPYPNGSLQAEVWRDGVAEWARDVAGGYAPPA